MNDFRCPLNWRPSLADVRDYTSDHPRVAPLVSRMSALGPEAAAAPPTSVDLRAHCSPVVDQGPLGSCTANAAAGLFEYFETRAAGHCVPMARLFLYKIERNLMQTTGDTGAQLRTAIQALVLVGAPPEVYYPYEIARFDVEPPAFAYALASAYRATRYYRLDRAGEAATATLARIKTYLAAGMPAICGFTCYESLRRSTGPIAFPAPGEATIGGHAVGLFGYDDTKVIGRADGGRTIGAFRIRNSWGTGWGEGGYGWLPYQYVLAGQADDFWTITSEGWVDSGNFA